MKNIVRRRMMFRLVVFTAAIITISAFAVSRMPAYSGSKVRLPTGAWLDPEGRSSDVGNMPLAMKFSPDGRYIVLSLSGWREQGIQIVERETGKVVQTIPQRAAFLGLAFSPDGKTLYSSGADEDAVFRYSWQDGRATLIDKFELAAKDPKANGTRFPAGLATSRDGRFLYVAENLGDSLAVIDTQTKAVAKRFKVDHYPYEIATGADGKVYVSAWGSNTVSVFSERPDGTLGNMYKIVVGRHPSALALNAKGSRLFVTSGSTDRIAVVDTRTRRVIKQLNDSPPSGTREGSTPNALALSADGKRLFVAEADNNAVAVFDLGNASAGITTGHVSDRLAGRIPCGWYPTALLASSDSLLVLNGKGKGTAANPKMKQDNDRMGPGWPEYTLGQLNGTITSLTLPTDTTNMQALTQRVREANNWNQPSTAPKYPPFKHIIYVIKENRTYDQVFGDMPGGDGDPNLLFFPRESSANHRALAERFGLFDRFFVNAEVSEQGHPWTTSAYVTDYTEKTTPATYSSKRGGPDDEGDTDEPVSGYLWDSAIKKGLTLRNYGEYSQPVKDKNQKPGEPPHYHYEASKRSLAPFTNPDYPSFDMDIRDQVRIGIWLNEFKKYVENGNLPALEIMHLPGDHTSGARAGKRTPRAYFADNDLAVGRMIEALSKSSYWKDTVVFVLEDDAQAGPDHVDSHRSVLMAVSAYNRGGAIHRFVNTTDVIATIEEILGLSPLSQFDRFSRPLREIFGTEPDLRPFTAITPAQSLDELNPTQGKLAQDSLRLDLHKEDVADMDLFNHILWRAIKGEEVPYPSPKQIAPLDFIRSR